MRAPVLIRGDSGQNSTQDGIEGRKIADFYAENQPWPLVQEHVVARFPEAFWPAKLADVTPFCGYSGAQIWRIQARGGLFCLRGWPQEMQDTTRLAWMHRTLHALCRGGCQAVPAPVLTRANSTWVDWQGRFWELTPWMPGQADFHQDASPLRLRAAVTALAEFHQVVAASADPAPTAGRSPALLSRAKLLHQLNQGGIDQLRQSLRHALPGSEIGPDDAIVTLGHEILALYPKIAPRVTAKIDSVRALRVPLQTCHGDLWHDHVLFTDHRVTGIIDFGNLRVDAPITDLARLLGSLVGNDPDGWQSGLEAYEKRSPLGAEQRQLPFVLDRASLLLSGINWIRWIFADGRQFPWPRVQLRLEAILQRLQNMS